MSARQQMPHDTDAEASVLSAMLLDARTATNVLAELTSEDFYDAAFRRVFDAMRELATHGHAIDVLGLKALLESRGELPAVGGQEALVRLIDECATAANVKTPVRLVRECRRKRDLARALTQGLEQLYDGSASAELVHGAIQADLIALGDQATPRGFQKLEIGHLLDDIEGRGRGEFRGLRTGFPAFDAKTAGLLPGEFVVLCAAPKNCKTTFAGQIALQVALQAGVGVGYVSAEMSNVAITERLVSALAGVPISAMRAGQLQDAHYRKIARAAGELRAAPLWIDDAAVPRLEDVVSRVLALKGKHPSLGLVIVDFLQLVQYRLKGRRGDEELTAISYALKDLAMRAQVVLIAPTQLNAKAIADRQDRRPTLRDISGSSGPLMAGDFVALLHRPSLDPGASPDVADQLRVYVDASRRTDTFEFALDWQSVVMRGIPVGAWLRPDEYLIPFAA